jgi:predicted TIM-barrel fold metal-dependent hydrolase
MTTVQTNVLGRVLDADSHEMAPSHLWGEMFGAASGEIADRLEKALRMQRGNDFYRPDLLTDQTQITQEIVWNRKGTSAPGAFDFARRLQVLDVMGVDRQLVFPSYAIFACMLMVGSESTLRDFLQLEGPETEIRELGRVGLAEYNAWAAATTVEHPDRVRCVAYLAGAESVAELVVQARSLLDQGVRAVNLPPGVPPGGVSPADPAMDEFWELLESHDIACVTHVGNEQGLLRSNVWNKAPAFKLGKVQSHELGLEPYSFATVHYASSHFLTVMILGGVFERFPRLRFGAIEQGSGWLGPLAEQLDMWARDVYAARLRPFISMPPSEYLARNVRVTPFNEFEPIERDLERYPQLRDCYCYSTDYPHVEGGKDSKAFLYEKIAPLGDDMVEKFFVTNSELLLPSL